MVNEKEKRVYNTYLIASKTSRNKPFTIRRNFENFEATPEYLAVRKLCMFFNKYPQINPEYFFKAPYMIYKDTDYFPLDYFVTQKAIKAYTIYLREIREQSPDSPEQIALLKESLKFIALFCFKNHIKLSDYITHKIGTTYSWTVHLRKHNITIYSLLEFSMLDKVISQIPKDEKDLLIDNIDQHIHAYKTRYNNSVHAKNLLKIGFNKLSKLLNNTNNK